MTERAICRAWPSRCITEFEVTGRYAGKPRVWPVQGLLAGGRNGGEGDRAAEKSLHGDFVRCVEHRSRSAAAQSLLVRASTRESAFRPAASNVRVPAAARSVVDEIRLQTLRPSKTIGDGSPHIGQTRLRQNRSVAIIDKGVNDRLGMNNRRELVRFDVEEMKRLDQLQPLVHQRGTVDGDFSPIDQFGWVTACSGLAFAICSSVHVRNGPPEAVSTIGST